MSCPLNRVMPSYRILVMIPSFHPSIHPSPFLQPTNQPILLQLNKRKEFKKSKEKE